MDWKKLIKKALFPPLWSMVFLSLLCAAALVFVFVKGLDKHPAAAVVYAVSAYTLTVVCIYCVVVLPGRYRRIRQRVYDHPVGNRYLTDRAFRAKVSLQISLGVNLLYAGLNLLFWYVYQSWWFATLAAYYTILSVLRLLLAGFVRKNELGGSLKKEWRRSRLCAYILLLVNLFLSGAVLMMVYQNRGYEYNGILIYVMAMYTFYSTIHASVDMVRYRKLGSPVLSTVKIISLCAALVSMLNLETAMFAQFGGEMTEAAKRLFIILTGAGISVVVILLSVDRIVCANKELRR